MIPLGLLSILVVTIVVLMKEQIDSVRRFAPLSLLVGAVPLVALARGQTEHDHRKENRKQLHFGAWIGEVCPKGNSSFVSKSNDLAVV